MKWFKSICSRAEIIIPLGLFVVALAALPGSFLGCGGGQDEVDSKSRELVSEEKQLWTCGMHPQVIVEEPGSCPICGMNLVPVKQETAALQTEAHEHTDTSSVTTDVNQVDRKGKKILYWRAPMDPTFISDKPGKSPMGMDLIPVYEGEEEITGRPIVSIDPVTVQNIGVQTAPVEKVNLFRVIRTVGHVDYNEKTLSRVNIKVSGWIEKLHVDETGQQVRRGQAMLEIYSPELVSTQEEYLLAVRNMKKLEGSPFSEVTESSRSLLESARRRLLYWDISERQIKDLEEKGTISKTVTLFAPVDGVVIDKMAEEGMRVVPGMDLFRIADLTEIWVYAHIYEYEVPWVKLGQSVEMDLPYSPGKTFRGKVDYIYPYLDQKARDIKVRLVFQNPDLELKPQMYANVQLESRLGADVTAVPTEAVIRSGKRNVVFVARGGGKFEPRDVILGPEGQSGLVQVLAGLQPGEEVVTSAQFLLDSESRLKEAIQKMLEARRSDQQAASKPDSQHNH
jgi:Cu(I)/Ag(I) efflux system membrane fusion protein/cobalt-zinc-cadmium efflux system membrane fusion protein